MPGSKKNAKARRPYTRSMAALAKTHRVAAAAKARAARAAKKTAKRSSTRRSKGGFFAW